MFLFGMARSVVDLRSWRPLSWCHPRDNPDGVGGGGHLVVAADVDGGHGAVVEVLAAHHDLEVRRPQRVDHPLVVPTHQDPPIVAERTRAASPADSQGGPTSRWQIPFPARGNIGRIPTRTAPKKAPKKRVVHTTTLKEGETGVGRADIGKGTRKKT